MRLFLGYGVQILLTRFPIKCKLSFLTIVQQRALNKILHLLNNADRINPISEFEVTVLEGEQLEEFELTIARIALEDQSLRFSIMRDQEEFSQNNPNPVTYIDLYIQGYQAASFLYNHVRQYGWPNQDYSLETRESCWIIALHADMSPPLQLFFLESMFRSEDAVEKDLMAHMVDRVLLQHGVPQVYGTQTEPFIALPSLQQWP